MGSGMTNVERGFQLFAISSAHEPLFLKSLEFL
jgi:hypothetical protein